MLSTTRGVLSPIRKRLFVGGVDLCHLIDGEGERVGHGGHVIDLVERKLPALAGLQVFVEHLVATDVEIPHRLRHRLERLRLVNRDCLFLRQVVKGFNCVVTLAVILGEPLARKLTQEVRLHEFPAKLGQLVEVVGRGSSLKGVGKPEFEGGSAISLWVVRV